MKHNLYGDEARRAAQELALVQNEDQTLFVVKAILRSVEGRPIVELEF